MAATVFFDKPYAIRICSISPLCIESMAWEKSTNNIVASRFFARTPSRIQRIVKFCGVLHRFLRKPFWFFHSIFSILGSMQLRSRALCLYRCKSYTSVVLGKSEVTLLREGEDASHCSSVYCVLIIYGITASMQYVVEFLGFPYFWGYFIKPCSISIFNLF